MSDKKLINRNLLFRIALLELELDDELLFSCTFIMSFKGKTGFCQKVAKVFTDLSLALEIVFSTRPHFANRPVKIPKLQNRPEPVSSRVVFETRQNCGKKTSRRKESQRLERRKIQPPKRDN